MADDREPRLVRRMAGIAAGGDMARAAHTYGSEYRLKTYRKRTPGPLDRGLLAATGLAGPIT